MAGPLQDGPESEWMKRLGVLAAAALALAGGLTAAQAQDRGRRGGQPVVTLYEQPGFQGRSISFYADAPNLADQNFNDRARSARILGSWRLCEDKNFRSRCEPFADDVADLGDYDFDAVISSLQLVGGRPDQMGGPEWRPGYQNTGPSPGVEGRSVVFFARPSINGFDLAAAGRASADGFCRAAGLGPAVHFDESERGRRAIGLNGEEQRNVRVLRDVLCRR